jgi:hypothetical protein
MKCSTPAADAASADARTDAKSTERNCTLFAGLGCATPTSCTNVFAGAIESRNEPASNADEDRFAWHGREA